MKKRLFHYIILWTIALFIVFLPDVKAQEPISPENTSPSFTKAVTAGFPKKKLTTIIVDNYHPYTYVNKKGLPDGFSVDLVKAVTQVMGMEIEFRVGPWDEAQRALAKGEIDLLPMMAYSRERDKIFDFSAPHTIAYDAFFIRKNSKQISSIREIKDKTIIVMNKDAAHDYLLLTGLIKPNQLILIDSLPDALRMLASGKGDVALMPKLVGLLNVNNLALTNLDPSPAVIDDYNRPFSFAVKEGNQALLERLTQGLGIIKSTGQYQEIYKKWFGALEQPGLPWNTVFKYIAIVAVAFLLIALGLIVWNASLRKQVVSQTKHLTVEIEERKRSEEALRRNEKHLRESQRIAHVGSWRLDVATNQVVWTEELYNMYGFDPSLPPPPYTEHMKLFTPESWERLSTALARTRDTGIPYTLELETIRKDGSNGWMWVQGHTEVDSAGKTIGLWGAAQDITARKRAEEEIIKANEELHSLAIRLQEVREETQTSISHDLHDDLGSKLAVLKMEQIELEGIISKLHDGEEKDIIKELSKRSKDIIDSSIQSARRIMTNLRPSVLDDFGLVEALKWQMEEFNSHTGITSEFHTDFGRVDVENNCATAVFRILQEVLGNVARHSGASKVFANLGMEGGSMFLEVTDNGNGITPDQISAKGSTGILGMRQRAKVFGGEISVSGEAGKGTTVVVKVPMKIKESA